MKKTLVTTLIASGIALATFSGAAHAKGRWSIAAPPTKCVRRKPKPSAKNMT